MVLGAWPVAGFFGLDLLALYAAFLINFRSGRSFEELELTPLELLFRKVTWRGERAGMALQSALDPPRPGGGRRIRAPASGADLPGRAGGDRAGLVAAGAREPGGRARARAVGRQARVLILRRLATTAPAAPMAEASHEMTARRPALAQASGGGRRPHRNRVSPDRGSR